MFSRAHSISNEKYYYRCFIDYSLLLRLINSVTRVQQWMSQVHLMDMKVSMAPIYQRSHLITLIPQSIGVAIVDTRTIISRQSQESPLLTLPFVTILRAMLLRLSEDGCVICLCTQLKPFIFLQQKLSTMKEKNRHLYQTQLINGTRAINYCSSPLPLDTRQSSEQ